MASVVARVIIVLVGSPGSLYGSIFGEEHPHAHYRALGVLFGEVPGHPVGGLCLTVIRCGIALAPDDLFRPVGELGWDLIE